MLLSLKRNVLILVVSVICCQAGYSQDIYISESFEGISSLPNDDWEVTAQDGVHFPMIDHSFGNPLPSVQFWGGSGQAGVLYHKDYRANYLAGGLTIEADGWLASEGSHYTDLYIGLAQQSDPPPNGLLPFVELTFNKNVSDKRNIVMKINSDDPNHQEEKVIEGAYESEAWNRARIVIRPDQKVEFYIRLPGSQDYELLWTTTKTVDPAFDGIASFYIQGLGADGNYAFADNVIVSGPGNLSADLSLHPRTLKLTSKGNYVTGYIAPPSGMSVTDLIGSSVAIVEVNSVAVTPVYVEFWNYEDEDGDGLVDTLMVKFDRATIASLLVPGTNTLVAEGFTYDGYIFDGSDSIFARE